MSFQHFFSAGKLRNFSFEIFVSPDVCSITRSPICFLLARAGSNQSILQSLFNSLNKETRAR